MNMYSNCKCYLENRMIDVIFKIIVIRFWVKDMILWVRWVNVVGVIFICFCREEIRIIKFYIYMSWINKINVFEGI